jgi:branched-chain amino acid transport system ATP-binding protein
MTMLKIRSLHAGYGNLKVLKGISMHINPGEIVTIIGANGAGKTTLLNAIAGLIPIPSGQVIFDKSEIANVPAESIVSQGCTLVPEGRQVFDTLTIRENLSLGAYVLRKTEGRHSVAVMLETVFTIFPRLRERQHQLGGTLSGGEQQMLAIGRALMNRPKLIMLDEPSMGLAPLIVRSIFQVISTLRESGNTILLVEQNARAALRVADRGYVLETGQIVLEGTADELLKNNDVQRAYLGKEYTSIGE